MDQLSPPKRQLVTSPASGRLDVQPLIETYTAGEFSTVPVIIRNPFDEEIIIDKIYQPSSTLVNVDLKRQENIEKSKTDMPLGATIKRFISNFSLWPTFDANTYGISFKLVDSNSTARDLNITAEKNSEVIYEIDEDNIRDVNITASEGAKVDVRNQRKDPRTPDANTSKIPPHCEIVRTFGFVPGHWLWSQPQTFSTTVQIDYTLAGIRRTQVVPVSATVKPPLKAMVLGAALGAILGSMAKGGASAMNDGWRGALLPLVTQTAMAVIAVVALSRRSGSQGLVTVEDFYGGFLTGALVAYGGASVFEDALRPGHNPTPSQAPAQ